MARDLNNNLTLLPRAGFAGLGLVQSRGVLGSEGSHTRETECSMLLF